MHLKELGSTSIPVLILLTVLSLLAMGVPLLVQSFTRYAVKSREEFDVKQKLIEKADGIVNLLLAKDPDEADSRFDSVFLTIKDAEGFTIELDDVSSYLGLNWARKKLIVASELLLDSESSAQELQQHREDTGLYLDMEDGYDSFFKDYVVLEDHFTPYSYFNINVSDEFVLRKLFEIRTGDKVKAELFHLKIQNYRLQTEEKSFVQPDELFEFLGLFYEAVYPVVNAEPVINVNFAPPSVLRAVLIASGIEQPEETVESLLQSRHTRPLSRDVLEFILGEAFHETPVGQYLGHRTWFWRLSISRNASALTWVLARVPQAVSAGEAGAFDDIVLRLVEESYNL
jgi:hypothetical protein